MKHLLYLFLLLALSVNAFGANSATKEPDLNFVYYSAKLSNGLYVSKVTPVVVNYDTINTDLVIYEPAGTEKVGIVGLSLGLDEGAQLTWKSGDDVITAPSHGGSFGYAVSIKDQIFLSTQVGQSLVFQSDKALPIFTVYVIEYSRYEFK